MQLPGRLQATTLGDLLGAIHRGTASGTLELVEPGGRTHRIHVVSGLVSAVEIDRASASLAEILRRDPGLDEETIRSSLLRAMASSRLHGEVLVRDFQLSPDVIGRALRQQILLRLHALEHVKDAQVRFRAAVRPPRGALLEPLAPREFLQGRRRRRDTPSEPPPSRPSWLGEDRTRLLARRTLGIAPGASADEIKRAYRTLVRSTHPDLHPRATPEERRDLARRFAEATAAYQALVA